MHFGKAGIALVIFMALVSPQAWAADIGPVNIHGFLSQGYIYTTAHNYLGLKKEGSFEYNEAGINFSTAVDDRLKLGVQLIARDMGDVGNNAVKLDWGFADYRWRDELGLRCGKVKVPTGFYNDSRDTDFLRTWILLPQSIYLEDRRDLQVANNNFGVYGVIAAGPAGSFEYQAMTGTVGDVDYEPRYVKSRLTSISGLFLLVGQTVDISSITAVMQRDICSQLIWNMPFSGLRLGMSWNTSKIQYDLPAAGAFPAREITLDTKKFIVISAEYKWKALMLTAEYLDHKTVFDHHDPALEMIADTYGIPTAISSLAYYGSIAYRFTPWLELGCYYSEYYTDKDDKQGHGFAYTASAVNPTPRQSFQAWQKDMCFTSRFDINSSWVFKLEGHHINGAAQVFDYSSPDELRKIWSLYAAKASFNF